jgi:hypothetical protein
MVGGALKSILTVDSPRAIAQLSMGGAERLQSSCRELDGVAAARHPFSQRSVLASRSRGRRFDARMARPVRVLSVDCYQC